MNQPRKPFVSITPEVDDDAIEAIAHRKGIRQFQPITPRETIRPAEASPAQPREAAAATASTVIGAGQGGERAAVKSDQGSAATPPAAPTPRHDLHFARVGVPDYAMLELKTRAAREDVTINHILLKALDQFGISIRPEDLVEDGRRRRQ